MATVQQARPAPHPAKGAAAMARLQQTKIARVLGVTPGFVSRCLNGYENPPARMRRAVAGLLDMSEAELFRDGDRR